MIKTTMGKMESFLSEDYEVCYPCVEASGICGGPPAGSSFHSSRELQTL